MNPSRPESSNGVHDDYRRCVDAHFNCSISTPDETRLRTHLGACADCRRYYERHLLLAKLDPAAPDLKTRLARGLGVREKRAWLWPTATFSMAVAMGVVLIIGRGPSPVSGGFAARGVASAEPGFSIYRVQGGFADTSGMAPNDELSFAYRNPKNAKRLLIFAVDEHRHVYWYHPAWVDANENPEAISVRPGAGEQHLSEAISHHLDGAQLHVYAVFTDAALHVRDIENEIAAHPHSDPQFFGAKTVRVDVRVTP